VKNYKNALLMICTQQVKFDKMKIDEETFEYERVALESNCNTDEKYPKTPRQMAQKNNILVIYGAI
jgi:hypothetical protein